MRQVDSKISSHRPLIFALVLTLPMTLGLGCNDAGPFFGSLELSPWQRQVGRIMLEQIESRLTYLHGVGLGSLTLDRTLRTQ